MHTQMDSLEYAYLVEDKTHFERMGIIQYLTILTIFTAAVFLLMLLFVYGKDWSTIDGAEPIMQSIANAITVVLLADTIVMKARENE